ncbi:DJ-1/PfpI family protein [Yinghuangia seranimata]|uniref:DJ-1/PfpI family protein n=1 Tax=Yinghuangia seranimata TaxID=408067 RepID=UPI00248B1DFF|nr:DJ-1/PfpI family protein [Yinghuangia seranimata]MDI2126545.1 DJ-1/PfpI family protein [Yinghuangia seranimata]
MTEALNPTAPLPRVIAFLAYPGMTLLDLVGPLQVMSALPRFGLPFEVVVVGATRGPYTTDTPLAVVPERTFDEVPGPDVLIVPGGEEPTIAAMADEQLIGYLRTAGATAEIVASVCTGALLLGEAGLLAGRKANTHWLHRGTLARFGATPVAERWVEDGPVITAAGVSAGIDMALHLVERLAGAQTARHVQLFLEYDPQPPQGPLDWTEFDIPSFAPIAEAQLRAALVDEPALLAKLLDD